MHDTITSTAQKVATLMEKLKHIESKDEAMAVALEMAATQAGLQHTTDARWLIADARGGWYEVILPRRPEVIGLTDEQFRSLRALIYG